MKTAFERYRERVSAEEEDAKVAELCEEKRLSNIAQLPPCAGEAGLFVKPNAPFTGNVPFAKGSKEEKQFRCWATLPELRYGKAVPGFVGDQAIDAITNSEYYKCMEKTRADLQIAGVVTPDVRFWIGAGAAGLGLVAAGLRYLLKK